MSFRGAGGDEESPKGFRDSSASPRNDRGKRRFLGSLRSLGMTWKKEYGMTKGEKARNDMKKGGVTQKEDAE